MGNILDLFNDVVEAEFHFGDLKTLAVASSTAEAADLRVATITGQLRYIPSRSVMIGRSFYKRSIPKLIMHYDPCDSNGGGLFDALHYDKPRVATIPYTPRVHNTLRRVLRTSRRQNAPEIAEVTELRLHGKKELVTFFPEVVTTGRIHPFVVLRDVEDAMDPLPISRLASHALVVRSIDHLLDRFGTDDGFVLGNFRFMRAEGV